MAKSTTTKKRTTTRAKKTAKKAPPKKTTAKKASAKKPTAAKKPARSKMVKRVAPKKATAKKGIAKSAAAKKKAPPRKAAPKKATKKHEVALVTFEQIQHFSVPPERLYGAWLDGAEHAAFTGGGEAEVDARVGGAFSAWAGYIRGKNVELAAGERIVQSWRAKDFPAGYPDSLLELHFVPESGGTRLHLRHVGVPAANAQAYAQGWHDYYWQPLRAWLATQPV